MGDRIVLGAAPSAAAPNGTAPTRPAPAAPLAPNAAQMFDVNRVYPEVNGSIQSVRDEIDDALRDMATFLNREPDEIMRMCSGHAARLSELRTAIERIEDVHRIWTRVRTRELEPTLEQVRFQFEIGSRRHTIRIDEYKIETGER